MTAYFDTHHDLVAGIAREISALGEDGAVVAGVLEKLDAAEAKLVFDVTLAAEWPGCPENIRDAIHRTVLRHGIQAQPPGVHGPDYGDLAAMARGLENMGSDLHTIFHALGSRRLEHFTDDPRTPLHSLFGAGEVRREGMCPVPIRYWRAQLEGWEPSDRATTVEALGQRAHAYALGKTGDPAKAEQARLEVVAALAVEATT